VTAVCGDGLANGVGVRDSGAPTSEEALTAGGLKAALAYARVRCVLVCYIDLVLFYNMRGIEVSIYASLYSGASNSALL